LRPDRHKVVLFALREQGLLVRPGSGLKGLVDLTKKKTRFINRQKGSGTRTLFDRLIARERIAPSAIRGYADEEFTHLAVAATVASDHADAGFGIRAAAAQYRLGFIPIATERYCLACTHAVSESPSYGRVLALLGSRSFRTRAGALPGYDVSASGTPLQIPPNPGAAKR
jgi:putative molybdopterin biosynthesis protein